MIAIINLLAAVINIYIFILLASIVFGWLVYFGVINVRNRFVYLVGNFLHRATEPVLAPIRRFLPDLGGIDVSPIIVFLLLYFIRDLIVYDLARALY